MSVKLLTVQHLEFLSLTGGCTGSSESTLVKMPHCWKSYVIINDLVFSECDCTFDGAVTCDAKTGRCLCLPGVTGPRCDTCLDRWVLIPNEGCRGNTDIVHSLSQIMDFFLDNH